MKGKTLRIIASALLFGVTVAGYAAPASRESLDALVTRVEGNNDLTKLYATHFNMAEGRVVTFIGGLQAIMLEKPAIFNVYALRTGEARLEKFEAGAIVFANRNERPVMDAYGNPLVKPGDPAQDETVQEDDDDKAAAAVLGAGAAGALTTTGLVVAAVGTGAIAYAASQNASDDNDPVPEPASMAIMGAALSMFAAARRKRNK